MNTPLHISCRRWVVGWIALSAGLLTVSATAADAPVVNVTTTPVAIPVDALFSYRIQATNAPTGYAASGLPAGLMLDAATGEIRGVVGPEPASFSVTLSATNMAGTGSAVQLMSVSGVAPIEMPTVIAVSGPAPGVYHAGDTLTFTLHCDVPYGGLTVAGGPNLPLTLGRAARRADYASVAGDPTHPDLTFVYTITVDDSAPNGITIGNTIDPNGGAIADRTNLPLVLGIPWFDASRIRIVGSVPVATAASAGTPGATATVTTGGANGTSATPTIGHLVNVSTRGLLASNHPLVAGFVINGAAAKRVLIRAVGPSLAAFGVADAIAHPTLTVYAVGNPSPVAGDGANRANSSAASDSVATAEAAAGAFPLSPGASDAALVATLPPGAYTAVVSSGDGNAGEALVEVYELADP